MKLSDLRRVFCVIGICLPAAVCVLIGGIFYFREVPDIVKGEEVRVRSEYRELALQLRNGRITGNWSGDKLPSVSIYSGKMAPGRWGFCEDNASKNAIIWYKAKNMANIVGYQCPLIRRVNFKLMFLCGESFILLVLVFLTIVGVRLFLRDIKKRDDFLAATVHDLTTPLVALKGAIGKSPEDELILIDRLLRLVRNITDFLKLGGKRRVPESEEFDLVELWHEVYRLFADDFSEEASGPIAFSAAQPVRVIADRMLVMQILWNLLTNELKYASPFGGIRVEAGICPRDSRSVEIVFIDNGPGLTAAERRKIFDRYYRAKSSSDCGKGGFGIGLCTSREFARAMGGDLTVCANTAGGCIFRLRLRSVS